MHTPVLTPHRNATHSDAHGSDAHGSDAHREDDVTAHATGEAIETEAIETQANTGPSTIDMLTPYQACTHLGIGPAALLALVNSGALPAYQFESAVRFRQSEVNALELPSAA